MKTRLNSKLGVVNMLYQIVVHVHCYSQKSSDLNKSKL